MLTIATPNHGTISGTQLNFLSQKTAETFRKFSPIYARAAGVLELTDVPQIMGKALSEFTKDKAKKHIDGKRYISIPAQFYHTKRQSGSDRPSLLMGSVTALLAAVNAIRIKGVGLKIELSPVHDGIVEERSNQLHPSPVGSRTEAELMRWDDTGSAFLHATHIAGWDCDHTTIMRNDDIGLLVYALLTSTEIDKASVERRLSALDILSGRVGFNCVVS